MPDGPAVGWPMMQSLPESATLGQAQPLADVVPGYIVKTSNEDSNHFTAPSASSSYGVDTPSSSQESSKRSESKKCACIVCIESRIDGIYRCPGCNQTVRSWYLRSHVQNHNRQDRGRTDPLPPCLCPVEHCRFSSKRWQDLRRHTIAKHCNNPTKFACSIIGCKHHGEGNGFVRKDKLTEHYRAMHGGPMIPGHVVRTLMPAPASSHAEASGSSSIATQDQ